MSWFINLFKKRKGLGLVPQPMDIRDYELSVISTSIKESVDLRNLFPEVSDQGSYNSCTAHAVCDMLDYLLAHKKKYSWANFDSSEAYLWYWSRFNEGTESKNAGVVLRDVFKAIKDYGFLPNSEWSYSAGYTNKPSARAILGGQIFSLYVNQLPKYYTVPVSNIKSCLSDGYPVVFGFPIYDNFQGIGVNTYSEFKGKFIGNHAMLIIGYTKDYYIVRNSWSKKYGDTGYYYIDCNTLEEHAFDLWTLK